MAGYAKLFSRILDSTVWREDNETRILWITMLALADQDGVVHCTIPGLADRARITLDECENGLTRFQRPDKYSWSKEEEGRRIRPVEGGWFLINHAKYRQLMSKEEQAEKTRIRVERHRAAKKAALQAVTPVTSNDCNDIAEAEADSPTPAKEVKGAPPTDLHPLQYATRLMEEIKMPATQTNLRTVAAAIKALMGEKSGGAAYEFLLAQALDAIDEGITLDKFWFEDSRWKGSFRGQPTKTEERISKNRAAIIEGLGLGKNAGSSFPDDGKTIDAGGDQALAKSSHPRDPGGNRSSL